MVEDPSKRQPRGSYGLTLIEVVIALAVLAFGLLGLAAMQIHAVGGGNSGRHATQAAALAQLRMEQIHSDSWTNIAPTTGWTAGVTMANVVQGSPNSIEQAYSVAWRIGDLVADWTRTIDVRVTWNEPNWNGRTVTISSVRYNREAL